MSYFPIHNSSVYFNMEWDVI